MVRIVQNNSEWCIYGFCFDLVRLLRALVLVEKLTLHIKI